MDYLVEASKDSSDDFRFSVIVLCQLKKHYVAQGISYAAVSFMHYLLLMVYLLAIVNGKSTYCYDSMANYILFCGSRACQCVLLTYYVTNFN